MANRSSSVRLAVAAAAASCLALPLAGCVVHDDVGRDPHYVDHHRDPPPQQRPEDHPEHQEERH